MKVALCLSGMVGSSQRWGDGEQLDYRISYDYLKEVIINQCDVDIFIHSWSVEHEKELCNLYKPKDFLFEKQVDFKYKNPKSFAIMSQGYTRKSSVRLALNYEITNNINYDFIVLTRFDLAWFKKFNFDTMDKSKIYALGPEAHGKINDFVFISNPKNMEMLNDSYDKLSELEDLTKSETKGTVAPSYHRAIWKHLNKTGLLSKTEYIFNRPWGNPKWEGDVRLLRLHPNA
jgi:hypothetical protein